jgi:hypothetical protein
LLFFVARAGFTQADGAPLDSSTIERSRLTSELQQAYREWLCATDSKAPSGSIVTSDGADLSKAKWFAYLAAKSRLVAANAKRSAA